jgi:lipoyl(octanoyl) transferase
MPLQLRRLGRRPYRPVWEAMQSFTEKRGADTSDELWLVEHPPVFTLGLNARPEHLLAPGGIEVVPVDRGGQVTYHGPGQAVLYLLLDLRRRQIGVRALVEAMEQAVIRLLADHRIEAHGRPDAPGVYVPQAAGEAAKVASVGLRIRRGCSYHGLALNVDVDLEPFSRINPCGYAGLPVTRLTDLGVPLDSEAAGLAVARHLAAALGAKLIG